MKRTVNREKVIPAFAIGIGDLEALIERILKLFDSDQRIYLTIKASLPSEELQFESVADLQSYPRLPDRIGKFSIWVSQNGDRHISITSGSLRISPEARVSASANDEAWCAGAVETVYSFLQSQRVWYHWILSLPVGWMLAAVAWVPLLANVLVPSNDWHKTVFSTGWIATVLALTILYIGRMSYFPSALIQITKPDTFIKKYGVELSLLLALISLILTVVGWFVSK
jgi:hypothetical protein